MNKWKLLLACGALCAASQFALAGGPDMPPPGHSSIFFGLGGAFDYAQYKNTIGAPATPTTTFDFFEDNNSIFGLSPVGQLGYEYFFGTGGFIGIKGLFNFIDKNRAFVASTNTSTQTIAEFQSMVQAMLEGGICINNNAFYLEGGYSALFTDNITRNFNNGGFVQGTQSQTLNGGVAGIGFRHYFWDSLFIDAVYSYSLYADGTNLVTTDSLVAADQDSAQLKQVRVQDIVLTVNYAFNF